MEREHSELQQHIIRTDWWCENLGNWRATITAAEVKHCSCHFDGPMWKQDTCKQPLCSSDPSVLSDSQVTFKKGFRSKFGVNAA